MKGVITKVWPKNERGPGSVVFSDGAKFSTFSDALLRTAEQNIGQMVEYTTETKGRYTNLASLTPAGGNGNSAPAQTFAPTGAAAPAAPAVDLTMRKLVERVAIALESINATLIGLTVPPLPSRETAAALGAPAGTTDPTAQKQAQLAAAVGDDAAAAMFDALKRKHAKKPEALAAAIGDLLASHGLGEGAGS